MTRYISPKTRTKPNKTMNAQGSRPRLESGADLVFFDPAGLNFAMKRYEVDTSRS